MAPTAASCCTEVEERCRVWRMQHVARVAKRCDSIGTSTTVEAAKTGPPKSIASLIFAWHFPGTTFRYHGISRAYRHDPRPCDFYSRQISFMSRLAYLQFARLEGGVLDVAGAGNGKTVQRQCRARRQRGETSRVFSPRASHDLRLLAEQPLSSLGGERVGARASVVVMDGLLLARRARQVGKTLVAGAKDVTGAAAAGVLGAGAVSSGHAENWSTLG